MRLLVDTSILIDYLRGGPKGQKFIQEIEENNEIELFIPTIVVFELFSGKSTENPKIAATITNLLRFFQRINLDETIAKNAGQLFRESKVRLQIPDYIIAASALQINAVVATLNNKHFEQIPNINIYPLPYLF